PQQSPNDQDNSTLSIARDAIEQLKGESLQVLDVSQLTTIAEYMLICSGRTARHVKSISDAVIKATKQAGITPHVEGIEQAEWVLIDIHGLILHIMQPSTRAYYQLEKRWDLDSAATESLRNPG